MFDLISSQSRHVRLYLIIIIHRKVICDLMISDSNDHVTGSLDPEFVQWMVLLWKY